MSDKEKEEKDIIENVEFVDNATPSKKRNFENIENIENIDNIDNTGRKKKKESTDNGEINKLNGFENTELEKTAIKLKSVSTAERTTLASLSSDRQTPVLEALQGRLVIIERSCTYCVTYTTYKHK